MTTPRYVDERNRVLLGNLPEDFLRVDSPSSQTNGTSPSTQTPQQQGVAQPNVTMQMTLGVIQAQLAKNYSLTKMDPYVRVRVGHAVFETHSDVRGGKLPNWNKTITSYLPPGIKTIHIEVYDERTLTPDERIAYGDYVIPDEALCGKFIDAWVPLSGKQGPEKEGSINITIYIRSVPFWSSVMPGSTPLMVIPQPGVCMPYYVPGMPGHPVTVGYPAMPQPLQNPNYPFPATQEHPYVPSEEDVKQMQEMFPTFDKEVIIGILENCRGNKDQATTTLLTLSDK